MYKFMKYHIFKRRNRLAFPAKQKLLGPGVDIGWYCVGGARVRRVI
jgi:hypothetical protein